MFEGVNVVLTTPFKKNGELDKEALRRKTDFLVNHGISGTNGVLVPTGSTGECHLLSSDEIKKVWDVVLEVAGDKATVVGGSNRTLTEEVIDLCKYGEKAGLSAVMNLAPYYWKPGPEAIVNHYKTLSDATTLPIMVYNNQYVNQVDIPVDLLLELCELENVKAVKDCTPSLEKMERLVRSVDDGIEIINGRGELNEPYGYLMGTKGYVSIVANYCPELTVTLHELALQKKYDEFMDIKNKQVMPVLDFISTLPPSQEAATIKAIEKLLSLSAEDGTRAPFLPITAEEKSQLKDILKSTGFVASN